ncbi:hypothetical protein GALL_486260 [mine drainage metagenome]|uniref:Uncharacterized protein n=1 Tax=mine drainage metagenome TaxID=410659 RepID=A0A1J5PDQ6_9ZZZZ
MFAAGRELVKIHHVDEAYFQLREMLAQQHGGGQRLLGGHVARAGHDDIRLDACIVARPVPGADAFGAVQHGGIHVQELQMLLLVADDDVDIVGALETMVGDRQQAVHIGRKVDTRDIGAFVDDQVEEARILMREAIVVLPPHGRGDEQIERRHRCAPGHRLGHGQPFGMLVEHGVDDVDESLVGGEEAVPAGKQVAFQPAFQRVLGQHFHHASIGRQLATVGIFRQGVRQPGLLADFIDVVQLVGAVLVGPEHAEVVHVEPHDVAQEAAQRAGIFGQRGARTDHGNCVVTAVRHA